MDVKELKRQLKKIRGLDFEIKQLNFELQYIEEGLFQRSSFANTKVQVSKVNNMANNIINTVELKDELTKKLKARVEERNRLTKLIDILDDPMQRTALRCYYVLHYEIYKISDELQCSESSCYRIIRTALVELANQL
ncbi:DUF1492 domain-containing protein [Streptococcus suis]|uniref:DUF1492 domain-containing protein n=1 Tax=Streptococcus suis TaxID=1307 RepID=UPI0003F799C8|nr:DUF1492 domain-containing protein [Streptococcus suis]MCB2862831.1 DUF1492 domain-containing protein [Streptococcus suis]MCB2889300.1 DUF1492 domain-containing protein [Streptococcus suis]